MFDANGNPIECGRFDGLLITAPNAPDLGLVKGNYSVRGSLQAHLEKGKKIAKIVMQAFDTAEHRPHRITISLIKTTEDKRKPSPPFEDCNLEFEADAQIEPEN